MGHEAKAQPWVYGALVSGDAPRLIVGNLDCEADFAALAGRPVGPASRRVLETIAGAATLLRVFARDGDRLWLPAQVAHEAMADVPGLPRPILESGPLAGQPPAAEILAWGETAAVTGMRRRATQASPLREEGTRHAPLQDDCDRWELPWRLPPPAPQVAARVNDRRFCLRLAGQLGCRLPGARVVASARQLEAHLEANRIGRWVLKAPFSAAGRWRVIHPGGMVEAQTRQRVERLFTRHGEGVLEPWMERTADVGCAAAVTPDGLLRVSLHRQLVDAAGRFRGIELIAGAQDSDDPRGDVQRRLGYAEVEELGLTRLDARPPEGGQTRSDREQLEAVLGRVAEALRRAGYSGLFGIDAWRYRLPGGGEAFQPLGEINGRNTFGRVARALVDRVRGPLGLDPGSRVRLVFGRPDKGDGKVRIVPLLDALSPGDPEARLEIFDPR